jgi:hypothetical protein
MTKVSEQYRALVAERKHLTSGQLGVFSEYWRKSPEVPEHTGNYLIGVRSYEPIIALYIQNRGWYLDDTIHAGLDEHVRCWMPLPITLKEAK